MDNNVGKVVFGGRPVFRLILGNEDGSHLRAFVHGGATCKDSDEDECFYWIYTDTPNYPEQESSVHLSGSTSSRNLLDTFASTDMYLYGRVYLDRLEYCVGENQYSTMLKAKVSRHSWLHRRLRTVEYYAATDGKSNIVADNLRVVRNQYLETLSIVGDGNSSDAVSPLIAVCLAYAFDRMIKPFGSRQDQLEVSGVLSTHIGKDEPVLDVANSLKRISQ